MKEVNGLYVWKKGEPNQKLSENFSTHEFECQDPNDHGQQMVSVALIELLEAIREDFQRPIRINSGYRTEVWNAHEGGSTKSQHCLGRAADISPAKFSASELDRLMKICQKKNPPGLGVYKSWVHVDVRTGPKARWTG